MTHLPFVAASYVLGMGVPLVLSVMAARRLQSARRRLAAIDPRGMESRKAGARGADARAADAREMEAGS